MFSGPGNFSGICIGPGCTGEVVLSTKNQCSHGGKTIQRSLNKREDILWEQLTPNGAPAVHVIDTGPIVCNDGGIHQCHQVGINQNAPGGAPCCHRKNPSVCYIGLDSLQAGPWNLCLIVQKSPV